MTRALLLAALFAAPLPIHAQDAKPAIDAEAKAVVEKAIEAQGGKEAIEKHKASNSKIKGEMSLFGMEIPFTGEIITMEPDKVFSQIDATLQGQQMAIVQIVNGAKVKSTMNGTAMPVDDAQKKRDEANASNDGSHVAGPAVEGRQVHRQGGEGRESRRRGRERDLGQRQGHEGFADVLRQKDRADGSRRFARVWASVAMAANRSKSPRRPS